MTDRSEKEQWNTSWYLNIKFRFLKWVKNEIRVSFHTDPKLAGISWQVSFYFCSLTTFKESKPTVPKLDLKLSFIWQKILPAQIVIIREEKNKWIDPFTGNVSEYQAA